MSETESTEGEAQGDEEDDEYTLEFPKLSTWIEREVGVNEYRAWKLAEHYQTRASLVEGIENETLVEVDGIGPATADKIYEWYGDGEPLETAEPDDTLTLDDDGLHVPDMLAGFVGEFKMRTPSISAEFTTTDEGIDEVSDGVLATYPTEGGWNPHLDEGMVEIDVPGYPSKVYEIDDLREEPEAPADD